MRQKLKHLYFAIDLRSLGLFRILFGCLLIYDWFVRWPNLEAFYTWVGVLPIDAPLPRAGGDFHFSLLDGFVSLPMVRLFFGFGLICYVLFLLGYRTKLFHLLSFLFFVSVSNRNILIRHGGDVVTLTMMMWSMFLPLGKRFSLDAVVEAMRRGVVLKKGAVNRPAPHHSRPSLAALVIVCQIALIYFMTWFAKFGDDWVAGTALYYALELDQFATPFGTWLATQPLWLIRTLTWGTLWVELAATPLILLPYPQPVLRRLIIVLLAAMHLGIWLTMEIGSFPFVMIATYSLLLLAQDWESTRRLLLSWSRAVTVYYDDTCGFCHRCAQLLAIADRAGHIRFIGNTDRSAFEHDLTKAETDSSIIVFDQVTQQKSSRSAAMAAIVRALPLPFHVFRILAWPGLRLASDTVYDWIARRRYRFSDWLGFTACGVARVEPDLVKADAVDPAPITRACRATLRVSNNTVVAMAFVSVLVDSYNINMTARLHQEKVAESRWMQAIIQAPQLVHDWYLFAPTPMKDDGWWVVEGVTESGRSVDPLTGKEPTFEKPANLSRRYDAAWRKYLYRIWLRDYADYRLYFDKYVTRIQHREYPNDRLDHFKLYYVEEFTQPPGSPKPFPTRRVLLAEHDCFLGDPSAPTNRPTR